MPSTFINLAFVAIISSLSTIVSLYFLIPYLIKKSFLDIPNARSSHKKVTPRGGGLGIAFGLAVGIAIAYVLHLPLPHFSFFIGLGFMAGISFLDDKKNLPAGLRLVVHLSVMALVIHQTGGLKQLPFPIPFNFELGWLGYILTGIWIIAVINFFNFLDGIDGYAGTQALLASIALTICQWNSSISTVTICIAFTSFGFLLFNWHPAKIFMGDVGSVSLGFAFATLPFYNQDSAPEPIVFSTAIFLWFFLADGAFTLIRRILNKEKIWEPHRTHIYQRLTQTGWSHKKVVILLMGLGTLLSALHLYLFMNDYPLNWISIVIGIAVFGAVLAVLHIRNKKKEKA